MVEWASLGIDIAPFAQEGQILQLVAVKRARDVDFLASNGGKKKCGGKCR